MNKRTDKENFYLTNEAIYEQWLIWKNSANKLEDRSIPEQLALYIQTIAQRMLNKANFRNYSEELKQDMVGDALVKCFKNLKNMNEDRKDSFFNYLTRCCYCSFLTTLGKHYKQVNLIRELTEKQMNELKFNCYTNEFQNIEVQDYEQHI